MVAKTPEGISLENLSKQRASVYIDPDTDLYLELQYLQSRADLTKCTCFDLKLLASSGKVVPRWSRIVQIVRFVR